MFHSAYVLYNIGHVLTSQKYSELSMFPVSQSLYFCERLLEDARYRFPNTDSRVEIYAACSPSNYVS